MMTILSKVRQGLGQYEELFVPEVMDDRPEATNVDPWRENVEEVDGDETR